MKSYMLYIVCVMLLLTGCVHEFPELEYPEVEKYKCNLTLVFDKDDFDQYAHIIVGDDKTRSRGSADHTRDVRFIVRLYPTSDSENRGSRFPSRSVINYHFSTKENDGEYADYTIPLSLDPGEYDIVVWVDHVPAGTTDDYYFNTNDFLEISRNGIGQADYVHQANDEYLVSWRGINHVTVGENNTITHQSSPQSHVEEVKIQMERPMARYHFITNDINKFLRKEIERQFVAASESDLQVPGFTSQEDINKNYKVVVRYAGYLPYSYNLFTDKPVNSTTGISYEGKIRMLDNNRAELSYDHVFVNHNQTSVLVAIDLYRRSDGQKLSSSSVIEVPIQRGKYTTVEGPFLTTETGSSVGIVTDFNGSFEIEIN